MKKMLVVVIVIFALAIGAGLGAYFAFKNKNADMNPPAASVPQKQKNNPPKENGPYVGDDFTIIAPPGWIQTHMPATLVSFQNPDEIQPKGSAAAKINFKSYIAVSFDNTQGKNIDEVINLVKQQVANVAPSISFNSETNRSLSGQPAKLLEAQLSQQGVDFKALIAIVIKENKYFIISGNTTVQEWPEYQNFFYDTINSFQFK